MAFYDPRVFELHVLLVDHDFDALVQTATAIQSISYGVTSVQDTSIASAMLSDGNMKFDLVMVDVSSTNLEGFKLVHQAIDLGYRVIIMSNNANATLVKSAIEDGAFLFMERSTAAQELKYIWQHLLREKTRRNNKGKAPMSFEASALTSSQNGQAFLSSLGSVQYDNLGMNVNQFMSSSMNNDNVIRFGRGRSAEPAVYTNYADDININAASDAFMRPKMCTEWTPELHEKFMDAVRQLGEGRCFPKDILELMNVPGLTRLQVASHLQKCRHSWNQSDERPTQRSRSSGSSSSSRTTRKYGLFPRLATGSQSSQLPPQENPNDEMFPNFNDAELYSIPISFGTIPNMEPAGLTDDDNNNNININVETMNEIININSNEINDVVDVGDMLAAVDSSFDFAASDDGLIIANSFDLQNSDSFDNISDQTSLAANQDKEFLESWISEFAREDTEC